MPSESETAYAIAGTKAMFHQIAADSGGMYMPPADEEIERRVRARMAKEASTEESATYLREHPEFAEYLL